MGMDLALGGIVLFMGVKGWLRGFTLQAIRLAGMVAAAYAAVPARDYFKPYAVAYLPTIRPDLIDRLLWWASAVLSYFLIVGVASLIVAFSRRQPHGLEEANRTDQFAGLGLGVMKGALVAAFLVAGLERYGTPYLAKASWAEDQIKESTAWAWNLKYRPASKAWNSPPVQEFIAHVKKMGLNTPSATSSVPKAEAEPPLQTASRSPALAVPSEPGQETDIDDVGVSGITGALWSILSGKTP